MKTWKLYKRLFLYFYPVGSLSVLPNESDPRYIYHMLAFKPIDLKQTLTVLDFLKLLKTVQI